MSSSTPDRPELRAGLRRSLWAAMADVYGHRWTSSYGDNPDEGAALTWGKVLADLSPQQLAEGLAYCGKSANPWPPTLPEFRAACLGIPELHAVRAELVAHLRPGSGSPSAFARLVWSHLDGFRWRVADAATGDRMLREAYDAARQHVMGGGALPEPAAGAIEEEKREPKPASPEVVEAAFRKLDEVLRTDAGPEEESAA